MKRALPLVALLPSLAGAATLTVGPGEAYTSIQAAIDAAGPGDDVAVLAGTYAEDLDFGGKNLAVVGAGASTTTIEGTGGGPVVTFTTSEGPAAVLEGFTITGGDGGPAAGGGVHVQSASPTLRDLVLEANSATIGGGLQLRDSQSILTNLVLRANSADPNGDGDYGYGGGAYLWQSDVQGTDLVFEDNQAVRGGGLYAGESTFTLAGGAVRGNDASLGGGIAVSESTWSLFDAVVEENSGAEAGGGLRADGDSSTTLSGVLVRANEAGSGAGGLLAGVVVIAASTFQDNVADDNGGGLYLLDNAAQPGATLTSVLFEGNEAVVGAGVLADGARLVVEGCRFTANAAGNLGGGLYVAEGLETDVSLSLFDGNTALSDGGGIRFQGGEGTVSNSLFAANTGSNGAAVHVGFGGDVTLDHVTAAGNSANTGGTVRVTSDSSLVLTSSILANPSLGSGLSAPSEADAVIGYSTIYSPGGAHVSGGIADPAGTLGNLSADPLFVAYSADGLWNDDLHLGTGSPAIDAGDPAGGADSDGGLPDQGAYGGPDGGLWATWVEPGVPDEAGDDDDSAGDDDDSTGDDDDSAGDDDDSGDDDDATFPTGDDDDLPVTPSTGGCDCSVSSTGGSGWMLLGALGWVSGRRRRR